MIKDDDPWDGDMGLYASQIPEWLEYCERKRIEGGSWADHIKKIEMAENIAILKSAAKQWVQTND